MPFRRKYVASKCSPAVEVDGSFVGTAANAAMAVQKTTNDCMADITASSDMRDIAIVSVTSVPIVMSRPSTFSGTGTITFVIVTVVAEDRSLSDG